MMNFRVPTLMLSLGMWFSC